jgi:hypothetical protein
MKGLKAMQAAAVGQRKGELEGGRRVHAEREGTEQKRMKE